MLDATETTATRSSPASGSPEPTPSRMPVWLRGVLPLLLLGALVAIFLRFGPVGVFQAAFPPVEELTIQRVSFPAEGALRIHVVNGGPEPVTIAQVTVDDAFWEFTVDPASLVPRLGSATLGSAASRRAAISEPMPHDSESS